MTTIDPGCEIEGTLTLDRSITIEGEFRGAIHCAETVTVGREAAVQAEIDARTIEIEGAVVCAGLVDAWAGVGLDRQAEGDPRTTPSARTADALDFWNADDETREALRGGVTAARVQAEEARSRIEDVDYAREVAESTKYRILTDLTLAGQRIADQSRGRLLDLLS